jgi:VanZ family protein
LTFVFKKFIPAIIVLIVVTVLLCLPGSSLPTPSGDWFHNYQVDKLIHACIFAVLVYLFCRPIQLKGFFTSIITKIYFFIAIICTIYGFIMELVQKWFIHGRGFEGWDIMADAVGCLIGYFIAKTIVKKVKQPTKEELQEQLMDYAKKFVQK